jgi:hypothetical protein
MRRLQNYSSVNRILSISFTLKAFKSNYDMWSQKSQREKNEELVKASGSFD